MNVSCPIHQYSQNVKRNYIDFQSIPVHSIVYIFPHRRQYSAMLWLKHLNVWETLFSIVLLTTKWLKALKMLMCVMALSEEYLVHRFPKLFKLNTTFLSSTPSNISQREIESMSFVPKGSELNLNGATHSLALWLWTLSTLWFNLPHL